MHRVALPAGHGSFGLALLACVCTAPGVEAYNDCYDDSRERDSLRLRCDGMLLGTYRVGPITFGSQVIWQYKMDQLLTKFVPVLFSRHTVDLLYRPYCRSLIEILGTVPSDNNLSVVN